MSRHKHDYSFQQVAVGRDGHIAVTFACDGRGCTATVTREMKVRRPDSRATTDEERMKRNIQRYREKAVRYVGNNPKQTADPWVESLMGERVPVDQ